MALTLADEQNPLAGRYPLQFCKAFPDTGVTGLIKRCPEDFEVSEILGFEPSGDGEHLFLYVEKRDVTTEQLALELARSLGVSQREIGYCGLKDRFAVTRQWLSLPWPIKSPLPDVVGERWQVLRLARHQRKLRHGIHQANHFRIRISHVQGDLSQLEPVLLAIRDEGFPNYFTEQRFGHHAANVEKAARLFRKELRCKPFQRSLYYSAARSYLFNEYLSLRIRDGSWNKPVEGDCFHLEGNHSLFGPEPVTPALAERVASKDIHPGGPLPGEGHSRLSGAALAIQQAVETRFPELLEGLREAGVKTASRPLRVMAKSLHWQLEKTGIELDFSLPSGSYATALIHQLVKPEEELWSVQSP